MIQLGLAAFASLCALIVTIMFRFMLPKIQTMEYIFVGGVVFIAVLAFVAKMHSKK